MYTILKTIQLSQNNNKKILRHLGPFLARRSDLSSVVGSLILLAIPWGPNTGFFLIFRDFCWFFPMLMNGSFNIGPSGDFSKSKFSHK